MNAREVRNSTHIIKQFFFFFKSLYTLLGTIPLVVNKTYKVVAYMVLNAGGQDEQ